MSENQKLCDVHDDPDVLCGGCYRALESSNARYRQCLEGNLETFEALKKQAGTDLTDALLSVCIEKTKEALRSGVEAKDL